MKCKHWELLFPTPRIHYLTIEAAWTKTMLIDFWGERIFWPMFSRKQQNNTRQCLLHENKPVCQKSAILEQNKKKYCKPKSHFA